MLILPARKPGNRVAQQLDHYTGLISHWLHLRCTTKRCPCLQQSQGAIIRLLAASSEKKESCKLDATATEVLLAHVQRAISVCGRAAESKDDEEAGAYANFLAQMLASKPGTSE